MGGVHWWRRPEAQLHRLQTSVWFVLWMMSMAQSRLALRMAAWRLSRRGPRACIRACMAVSRVPYGSSLPRRLQSLFDSLLVVSPLPHSSTCPFTSSPAYLNLLCSRAHCSLCPNNRHTRSLACPTRLGQKPPPHHHHSSL